MADLVQGLQLPPGSPAPLDLPHPHGTGHASVQDVETPGPSASQRSAPLEMVPGGFRYREWPVHDLTGRPRGMLEALLKSRFRRCSASDLAVTLGVDADAVTFPEQVVRDTAKKLRKALRDAVQAARLACEDPLPSKGSGKDLAYCLDLP